MALTQNFLFVERYDEGLAGFLSSAERQFRDFPDDPMALGFCLNALRKFCEQLVFLASIELNIVISPKGDDLGAQIERLGKHRRVPERIKTKMDELRKKGNWGSHSSYKPMRQHALRSLRIAHDLSVWYIKSFRNKKFEAPGFEDYESTVSPISVEKPDGHPAAASIEERSQEGPLPLTAADASKTDEELALGQDSSGSPSTALVKTTLEPHASLAVIDLYREEDASEGADQREIQKCADTSVATLTKLGEDTTDLLAKCGDAIARIDAASGPFLLGVLGEAKSGKSSLINALVGDCLAFVDEVEATPVLCCFRHGPKRIAKVIYIDSRFEYFPVDEINRELADRRDDKDWLSRIRHIEYESPTLNLAGFEIWDSPGIGGNDTNEFVANRFRDLVGGVIWVFHCHHGTSATVSAPLQSLATAGKKIIAVINAIDLLEHYTPSDAQEDVAYYMKQYRKLDGSPLFEAVIPLSAKKAIAAGVAASDPELQELRDTLSEHVLRTAESDKRARISAAIGMAAQTWAHWIGEFEKGPRDRLGLYDQIRSNLDYATKETLQHITSRISDQVAHVFDRDEWFAKERARILVEKYETRNGSPLLKLFSSPPDFRKEIDEFEKSATISKAWDLCVKQLQAEAAAFWTDRTQRALKSVADATPRVSVYELDDKRAENGVSAEEMRFHTKKIMATILVSAAALISSVATAHPIFWPALIFGAPVFYTILQGSAKLSYEMFLGEITNRVAAKKAELEDKLRNNVEEMFSVVFDWHIQKFLTDGSARFFGKMTEAEVRSGLDQVKQCRTRLDAIAQRRLKGSGTPARGAQFGRERFVITPDAAGARMLDEICRVRDSCVDIIATNIEGTLSGVLKSLRPTSRVRLVTSARIGAEHGIATAFGDWTGQWEARVVSTYSGDSVALESELLIVDREAFALDRPITLLGKEEVVFVAYPFGRIAARYEFDELWANTATKYGRTLIRPLRGDGVSADRERNERTTL